MAASVGMIGGHVLSARVSGGALRRGFAWSVVALGGFLLVWNLGR